MCIYTHVCIKSLKLKPLYRVGGHSGQVVLHQQLQIKRSSYSIGLKPSEEQPCKRKCQ